MAIIFGQHLKWKVMALADYLSIKILKVLFSLHKSLMGMFAREERDAPLTWLTAGKAAAIFLLNSDCCMINTVLKWKLEIWMWILCIKFVLTKENVLGNTGYQNHAASALLVFAFLYLTTNQRKSSIHLISWANCNLYLRGPADYGVGIYNWIQTNRAVHFPAVELGECPRLLLLPHRSVQEAEALYEAVLRWPQHFPFLVLKTQATPLTSCLEEEVNASFPPSSSGRCIGIAVLIICIRTSINKLWDKGTESSAEAALKVLL